MLQAYTQRSKICRYLVRCCWLTNYFFITSLINCSFSERKRTKRPAMSLMPTVPTTNLVFKFLSNTLQCFTSLGKILSDPLQEYTCIWKYKLSSNKKSKEETKKDLEASGAACEKGLLAKRGWDIGARAGSYKQMSAALHRLLLGSLPAQLRWES